MATTNRRLITGMMLGDPRRPRPFTDEQYFKTPDEMAELFADLPEALANSVEIAKRCILTLELGKSKLPDFPSGEVHVVETVQLIGKTIDTMAERMRKRILRVGESDPVSQDALIEASDQLEKQGWMLRAQLAA